MRIVGVVSDGLQAIQKAEELQPDVILLDVGLPKLNGIEAARRIRKVAPNSKILFLSQEVDVDVARVATGQKDSRKIASGPSMTASKMVREVKNCAKDWTFNRVSLGYPGPVINGHPLREPHNLGGGWMKFDFREAFGCPVKVINDAAMQAIGSYKGGRMLFLGLGTGLGSAMIVDGILEPMELAHLTYKKGKTYEDYLGLRGLKWLGKKKWRRQVAKIAEKLKTALEADYVVLGGGNIKKLKKLPPGTRLGNNQNAFLGGFRMWADSQTASNVKNA
jgi:polyphosphate glucokinase